MTKESEDIIVKRMISLISVFGIPIISGVIWVCVTITQIEGHMQGFEQQQRYVDSNQASFNRRQLQYDELNKQEIQHIGHILSKIDTNAPRLRRK